MPNTALRPRPFRAAASALTLVAALVTFLPAALVAAPPNAAPRTGEALVREMRARWSGKWYRTLTFVQRTVRPNAPDQTWYETAELPGRLRIDVAPLDSQNTILFRSDSAYRYRGGRLGTPRPSVQALSIVIADVYAQPADTSVARLRRLGFDLATLGTGTWRGRPVWTVGAAAGDSTSPQFWVDRERLYTVRLIERDPGGARLDTRVGGHQRAAGGWTETEVEFYRDGTLEQRELYSDVRANVSLDADVFTPGPWRRPSWIPLGTPAATPAPRAESTAADTLHLEVGSPEVDGGVYRPHAARVRVRVGDDSTVTADWTNELTLGDSAGKRVMRWVTRGTRTTSSGPLQWEIRQTYDARTLAPLGYASSASTGAYTRFRIDGRRVQGVRRTVANPVEEAVDGTLERLGFIASATDLVPLAVGLKRGAVMTAPVWGPAMARAETRVFTVVDEVPLTVEGAQVRAWKVLEHQRADGKLMATWYLTNDSPYMVYGEVPLPNGQTQRMTEVAIP